MDWITSGLAPLYTIGVKLYNYMLGFSLGFGLNTPQGASSTAWAYVSGTLFPFRQVGNLRESMTIETGVNVLIKVLLGNLAINSVLWFSKWVFSVTNVTGGVIIGESDFRGLEDSSVNEVQLMVLMVIGIIFLIIAIVCAATIFITMVGRTIQLYMLAATGPLAVSCIPGGPGIQNAAGAWIKTLLSKSFSIVVIVMFVVLVSKLNLHDFLGDNILTDIILPTGCIENMFMMMLTAAGVKGADLFLKQTFGI